MFAKDYAKTRDVAKPGWMSAMDYAIENAKIHYERDLASLSRCLPRIVLRIVPRSINQDLANLDFAKNFTIYFTQYRSLSPTA